jgi:hypothetical protein
MCDGIGQHGLSLLRGTSRPNGTLCTGPQYRALISLDFPPALGQLRGVITDRDISSGQPHLPDQRPKYYQSGCVLLRHMASLIALVPPAWRLGWSVGTWTRRRRGRGTGRPRRPAWATGRKFSSSEPGADFHGVHSRTILKIIESPFIGMESHAEHIVNPPGDSSQPTLQLSHHSGFEETPQTVPIACMQSGQAIVGKLHSRVNHAGDGESGSGRKIGETPPFCRNS